tara:strand:+ start:407 stop:700 length:294 start_codon:yes stop_codon:yes gene_type:complete
MIIKRKPRTALYWGENLDPKDLAGTCDGQLYMAAADDNAASFGLNKTFRILNVGERTEAGPVVLTLVKVDHLGAHWDVRAPRHIRILRDDAREVRGR